MTKQSAPEAAVSKIKYIDWNTLLNVPQIKLRRQNYNLFLSSKQNNQVLAKPKGITHQQNLCILTAASDVPNKLYIRRKQCRIPSKALQELGTSLRHRLLQHQAPPQSWVTVSTRNEQQWAQTELCNTFMFAVSKSDRMVRANSFVLLWWNQQLVWWHNKWTK